MIDNQKILEECRKALKDSGYPSDYFESCVLAVRNTFPKILLDNAESHPNEVSMRKKDLGIWQKYTWKEVYTNIKQMALGLKSLGLERGDKVCVVGDNDPEWYWAEIAIQSMGGACVGLYLDAMAGDVEYIVNNSDSVLAFAKDQEQVDKFLESRENLPLIRRVIFWDDRGMVSYKSNPWLLELNELKKMGAAYEQEHPGFFEESVELGTESDTAVLSFTSGTTSLPKGAVISQEYLIKGGIRWCAVAVPQKTDVNLSYSSPAWIAEQMMIAMWLVFRIRTDFPEAPETVMENIREVGPRQLALGPMQWQDMLSKVQMKIMDTGPIRRWTYQLSLQIGYRLAEYASRGGRKPPFTWRMLGSLADLICFRHIRDSLGLSRLRYGLTGGATFSDGDQDGDGDVDLSDLAALLAVYGDSC